MLATCDAVTNDRFRTYLFVRRLYSMRSSFKTSVFFCIFRSYHHWLPPFNTDRFTICGRNQLFVFLPLKISQLVPVVRSPEALLRPFRLIAISSSIESVPATLLRRLSWTQLIFRALRPLLRIVLRFVLAFQFGMWVSCYSHNGCHTQSSPLGCLWLHFQTLLCKGILNSGIGDWHGNSKHILFHGWSSDTRSHARGTVPIWWSVQHNNIGGLGKGIDLLKDRHALAFNKIAWQDWQIAIKAINNHRKKSANMYYRFLTSLASQRMLLPILRLRKCLAHHPSMQF